MTEFNINYQQFQVPGDDEDVTFARAIYDYTAANADEIDIHTGNAITVLRKGQDGWWRGIVGNNCGLFPATYVEPCDGPALPPVEPEKCAVLYHVRALYNYVAPDTESMSFNEQDIFQVISEHDPDWFQVRNADNLTGFIPRNYAERCPAPSSKPVPPAAKKPQMTSAAQREREEAERRAREEAEQRAREEEERKRKEEEQRKREEEQRKREEEQRRRDEEQRKAREEQERRDRQREQAEITQEIEKLRNELADLEREREDLDTRVLNVKGELDSVRAEIETLKENEASLKDQIKTSGSEDIKKRLIEAQAKARQILQLTRVL